MANPAIGKVECSCCGFMAEVRETIKRKPYIVCDECGFQGFARGSVAVANLLKKMTPVALPKEEPNTPPPVVAKPPLDKEPEAAEVDPLDKFISNFFK